MISFYMRTPSNFDIEYGYGGAVVDWQEHIVHEFTRVSLVHDFSRAAWRCALIEARELWPTKI